MRYAQQLVATFGLILLSAACNGSTPTQPAAANGSAAVVTTPTPAPPTPTPTPPGTPAPPAPPTPVPAPQPQALATYSAATEYAHWFGPDKTPLFGDTFTIEVWPNEIWMHNTRLPIVHRADDGLLIAREGPMIEVELRPATNTWYLRGGKGDAKGTMVKR